MDTELPAYRAHYIYIAADTGYTVPEGYTLVVEGVDLYEDQMFLKGWLYPISSSAS